jgi:hypothetical protein
VSFGNYARQVRDATLPHGRRVSALRSCVQLYRPIGFHATFSFLAQVAGPYDCDEAALLRALDALVASRRVAVLASGGRLDAHHREVLTDRVAALQRRIDPALWRADRSRYFHTLDLLRVARLVMTADTHQR